MNLLLDICGTQIDLDEFIKYLLNGLNDSEDIQLICHPMVIKLSILAENVVLNALDKILEPLNKIIFKNLRTDAVKQEVIIFNVKI